MTESQANQQEEVLKQFDPLHQHAIPDKDAQLAPMKKDDEKAEEDDEEPFYDFQKFAKQLQSHEAEPIVKYTKSFLRNFHTQRVLWAAAEQQKLVNDFKVFIYAKFLEYEPFKSLDKRNLRNAQEGMEKLVMGKLYNRCFSPCLKKLENDLDEGHKTDLQNDRLLHEKVREFAFVEPRDLDVPTLLAERLSKFVKLSGEELDKINRFKAPRDKMICVLNSCKVIFAILRHHKLEDKGADSFIPLLIFTILKGDIRALVSNVRYIERFRYEEFIQGEASYYLNSLEAAINYIMTLEKDALATTADETFENRYQDNQKRIQQTQEATGLEETVIAHKSTTMQSPLPSEYILHPLDEVTHAVIHKFNELFAPAPAQPQPSQPQHDQHAISADNLDVDTLARKIEQQEHASTLDTLQSMFPEMDREVIEDVCIAKKYRVGASVDVLLSL